MDTKYFLLWLPMIFIAFANATIRELLFIKHFSEFRAHQFSTITLIILCAVYIWIVLPELHIQNNRQAFTIGLIWVLLTVAFEFTLGRLANKPWSDLLQDYNIFAGRLWGLFLLLLFILPYLVYTIRFK